MLDRRSRPLRDLRVSVDDRCNFRCTYCMPKEIFGREFVFMPSAELLTFEEITRLAREFAAEGISKVRLTGGEPLLRRHLEQLFSMLAGIDGITDIAMTTNCSALARQVPGAESRGPHASHRQPPRARRRNLRGDDRCRLPGCSST